MQIRLRIDATLRIIDAPAEPTHELRATPMPVAPHPPARPGRACRPCATSGQRA